MFAASGTLRAEVRPTCTVSIAPPTAAYNAFGGSATVSVTVNSPSCRWSAGSDASWFPFVFEPAAAGNGSFSYVLPQNSTPFARTANIVIRTSTGQTTTHAVSEEKPLGCSYVTVPEELVFTAAGGPAQFTVVATPADCRWTSSHNLSSYGVFIVSGLSDTGTAMVQYFVPEHGRNVDVDGYIEIAGLSGLNPRGRHHVIIRKR